MPGRYGPRQTVYERHRRRKADATWKAVLSGTPAIAAIVIRLRDTVQEPNGLGYFPSVSSNSLVDQGIRGTNGDVRCA